MKKIITMTIIVSLLFPGVVTAAEPPSVSAVTLTTSEEIIYLDNGDSITIEISEDNAGMTPLASSYTKSGNKKIVYKNSSGTTLWTYTLSGTFKVISGTSATCTAASHSVSISSSAWKKSSASSSKSGNTASGSVSMKEYRLGLLWKTVSKSITLKCNTSGTLS